jgi:hypothetical protein
MILICCDSYVLDMHRSSISDFSLSRDQRINSCISINLQVGPVIREQQIKLNYLFFLTEHSALLINNINTKGSPDAIRNRVKNLTRERINTRFS